MNRTPPTQATTRPVRQVPERLREAARDMAERAWYARTPDGLWTARRWARAYNYVFHPRLTAMREMEQLMWDGDLGQAYIELHEIRRAQELADYDRQLRGYSELDEPAPPAETKTARPILSRHPETHAMDLEAGQ